MRQLFRRLLVVACRGIECRGNLTVTVTRSGLADSPRTRQKSLQEALEGYRLDDVEGIEVSAGDFKEADWIWLKEKKWDLGRLEKFEVTSGIGSVADIPDTSKDNPYFRSSSLKELHVAELQRVGDYAFYDCPGLTSVSLPAATKIGNGAFLDCSWLTSLQLGVRPPSVERDAFSRCPMMRNLELLDADGTPLTGDALTNAISRYRADEDGYTEDNLWYGWAFEDAPAGNLSGTINGVAFSGAASLEAAMQGKDLSEVNEVTIARGTFQVADWGFLLEQRQHGLAVETFIIESSVDRVADMPKLPLLSPSYLSDAKIVSIAKLRKIGDNAFHFCSSLTSVSLPAATEIGERAFEGCTGLTSVLLPAVTRIDWGAFGGCAGLTHVSLPAATEISGFTFDCCKSLTSVSLPAVTRIGWGAFVDCAGLTSVSLPVAAEIDGRAFSGCMDLTRVSLPAVTKIGKWTFDSCTGLESVSLPAANEIGDEAFWGCCWLTRLQLGAIPPSVGRDAFSGCPVVRKLELIDTDGTPLTGAALTNAISRYRAVEDGDTEDNLWYVWAFEDAPASNLSGTIDGVAFSGAISLDAAMQRKELSEVKEVTITGGRFQASDWGFLLEHGQHGLAIERFIVESSVDRVADMPDLPQLSPQYLPKAQQVNIAKIQKIGYFAFSRCYALKSVSLPAATEIGRWAFKDCYNLKSVSLPAATEIGGGAFEFSTGLTSVSLPVAREIGQAAFLACTGLTSVSLPVATEIGGKAFESCSSLESVSLPVAQKIGYLAFNGCKGLMGVSLPAATEIDDKAFYYCTDLTSASLPAATKIGMYAFNDCKSLTSVSLPAVTRIGWGAFSGCTGLTSVQLGPSPASAGWDAFANCPNSRTLIITDAAGVPLVGEALAIAADKYHRDEGASNDGKWQGFAIENNPPMLLFAKILPSGAGAVKVTRKKDGATVNQGDVLTKGDVLEVQAEHANGYRVQAITAEGAKKIGEGNEWEVTAMTGEVIFTVEFEKAQEENNNNDPTPVESVLLAQVQLSPNPTYGQVTVDAGTTLARCEVYSSTGALLQAIESPESVFTIDLTASPSGVYLVRLVDMHGGCKTLRVVKQ